MKYMEVLSVLVLTFLMNVASQAQLVTYDFEGATALPSQSDGNLGAGVFLRNDGNTASYSAGNGGGDAISGSGWTGSDSSSEKYWEFTVTANAGVRLDLSALDFDYRSTPTGPTNWEVSINGTTVGSGTFQNDSTYQTISAPLSLSDLPSAAVRISGFGASSGGGTLRIDNVMLDGLAVTPVPEPSTWLLLGTGVLLLAHRFRRRS